MYDKLRKIREERAAEDRGFTLIELLVVVVIIGILIAIAIPLYLNYQKGAHDKAAESDLHGAITAFNQCATDNATGFPLDSTSIGGDGSDGSGTLLSAGLDASFTITCNGTEETINLSSGTTLKYMSLNGDGTACSTGTSCAGFALEASNSGGHTSSATGALNGKSTYSYNSVSGSGVVSSPDDFKATT